MNMNNHCTRSSYMKFLPRFAAWLAAGLLLSGCGGGDGQDPDPLVEDFGMAFVMRPLAFNGNGALMQPDIREIESYTPGGDLYYRDLASPSAPQRNISGAMTGGMGDVKDVEVSYDGTRLLFAMRMPDIPGLDPEDQPTWNLWEYDIAAYRLFSVLPQGITAEAGQDVAPHYLPDGRIIFSSTRQRQAKRTLLDEGKPQFAALDENRNEHAMVLHVAEVRRDQNGDIYDLVDIEQVSMNQSHDLDSTVLDTGEVVFSRWDHMGSRNAISLYRMHPDGSELQPFYGAHSHATGTNGSDVQFLQPRQMADGKILTVLLPFTGSQRGGDLMLIDVANYIDNYYPTTVNLGALFGPAQEPATANVVHTDNSISPGGRFMSAWPLDDGTNRMLVSWSACRVVLNSQIMPCTAANLANPAAVEADPIYGIFLYDMDSATQLPIVVPQEGMVFTDVVAAAPRTLPPILYDKQQGVELETQAYDEGVGYLDIRSVYDVDGVDTAPGGIAVTADPALTLATDRPARFLRIVKAVGIPDNNTKQVPGTAFGRSSGQLMREIIGYVPVQPDGSVRVKVPANVPLAISVLDADGRRMGARHQNWLQLRPGETVVCNGCHSHASGVPHGHPQGPVSIWAGAQSTGVEFPNTRLALSPDYAETMAQTLTRLDPATLLPSVDLFYDDVWTNPAVRTPDASFSYSYATLDTPAPATTACQTGWDALCRSVIHYEQHIHPLWKLDRGANTCTNCHNRVDAAGMPMMPDAQLDLGDGLDPIVTAHFRAYRELLFQDFEEEIGPGGSLQDVLVPGLPDPVTGFPTQVPVTVNPPMSTAGARASAAFFSRFVSGASHDGFLTTAELRLLAEWLDIGAQYYNDPFAVP
jgi:hypothetical protein